MQRGFTIAIEQKFTLAAGVFSELKFRGLNVELITEYAKEMAKETTFIIQGEPQRV